MKLNRIVSVVVLSVALLLPAQVALAGETAFQKETRVKLEKIEKDVAQLKEMLNKQKKPMSAAEKKRFDEHFVQVGTEMVKIQDYLQRGAGHGD